MPTETGNTLMPPPRLDGSPEGDRRALNRWMQDLYNAMVLGTNVIGTLGDHEARITALEAKVASLEARVTELEGP